MKVTLQSGHLLLDSELVNQFFKPADYVFLAYHSEEKKLVLSPTQNAWFARLHDAQQSFLKLRNQQGDCSTSLRSLLLDHDLDSSDRELTFDMNYPKKLVKVDLR